MTSCLGSSWLHSVMDYSCKLKEPFSSQAAFGHGDYLSNRNPTNTCEVRVEIPLSAFRPLLSESRWQLMASLEKLFIVSMALLEKFFIVSLLTKESQGILSIRNFRSSRIGRLELCLGRVFIVCVL